MIGIHGAKRSASGRAAWWATLLLVGLVPMSLVAQDDVADVDLVLQTEHSDAYEEYLDQTSAALWEQLDAGIEPDKARLSLILIKLSRLRNEAEHTAERVDEARADIDEQLLDLAELIGDSISEDDPQDLEDLLRAIGDTFVDDPDFEAEAEAIVERIETDNDEIDAALDEFGEILDSEVTDISDLAEELLDSEGDFAVTVRIEGPGVRDAEVTTITRADLDELETAIEDSESAGQALADAVAELGSAAADWTDAVDLFDLAESTEDNQAAIAVTRSALTHLDAALLSLETAFDTSPLSVELDTGPTRELIADADDILGGRTFAIGDKSVRPVALIESRTGAGYLTAEFLDGAVVLALLARQALDDAEDHDSWVGWTGVASIDIYHERSARKARTRGWTWVLLATSSLGLSDPADEVFLEFWSSSSPVNETFRGYFPEGMSASMLEVLGVDLVVNTNATGAQMDDHMAAMRTRFSALAVDGDQLIDPAGAVVDTMGALQAHAGLAIVRTYFLVADNHQDVLDVLEMTMAGDIVGIVDRFDTEDFDYSASLDSTKEDLDLAREDEELVFLVLDKLDDDGNLFGIETDDEVIPLPLTGEVLDLGLGVVGSVAQAATELAELGGEAVGRAEESLELDLDPNELDFTEAEEPLDFALALERSNPDFLTLSDEGASDMLDMGEHIEDALVEFADAVTEMADLTADLEEEEGADLGGMTEAMADLDDFYQEMRRDFVDPAATTDVDGEPVDMSAWFDHPPEQLLQSFIGYLDDDDDTDNTLGGLLPGRKVQSVVSEERSESMPDEFGLQQNFPNPFNSGTVIEFALAGRQSIRLGLYNLAGQQVAALAAGTREAGSYRISWDGTDRFGRPMATGVYLYRLETEEGTLTRRLLLLR